MDYSLEMMYNNCLNFNGNLGILQNNIKNMIQFLKILSHNKIITTAEADSYYNKLEKLFIETMEEAQKHPYYYIG